MNYKVIILDEAKVDIIEARHYYTKILKSLGKRFTTDVRSTVAKIRTYPLTFGYRFNNFRTANLSIFPYQVHYIINKGNSTIIIFAILHASRDSETVKKRLG
jgi:plasmid stabilization system protein ParE